MRRAGDPRDRTDDLVPETPGLLVAAVPEPRPEILARVLAGLRDLPDAPTAPRERSAAPAPRHDDGADRALADRALPRRRA